MQLPVTTETAAPIPVSVLVHVLNEQINLPHALASVCGRFTQVFVIDAGSTDATKEIALQHGATFVQISGDRSTLVKQRNWALDNLPFSTEWVYVLDADESVPDDLYAEISGCVASGPDNIDGYWVRYKEIILGRWLKRSSIYPNWNMRLFKHRLSRYEDRSVNAHVRIDPARSGRIQAHFIHDDRRGFASYIRRLSGVIALEAASVDEISKKSEGLVKGNLFSSSFIERRRALKRLHLNLPCRPLITFCYLYVFRMGFLEGRAGLYACLYRASQDLFIDIMRYEARVLGKK
jgi:glycosyltransferase involved in cell wall biosynthesis